MAHKFTLHTGNTILNFKDGQTVRTVIVGNDTTLQVKIWSGSQYVITDTLEAGAYPVRTPNDVNMFFVVGDTTKEFTVEEF